ncbi:tetratricopeptide repeat protein [Nocardioides sambongensis]|uniref:tetratricopeptide repeat protein n=1 Tax=Nocardioides sambongensis TaxID=2589074 RepID=UPI00112965A6|nr:tetratricopeptide repeat protein [Nocardioides sambongensis]
MTWPASASGGRVRHAAARVTSALLLCSIVGLGAGCSGDSGDEVDPKATQAAVQALVDRGASELATGDLDAATSTFDSVLELDAGNAVAHYNLGLIAQQSGSLDSAITHYDAALDSDGDYGPALYNKAILLEGDDLEGAVELYRETIDAQPAYAPAYMRLGFALDHLGRADEAQRYLERGVQLDPEMAEVAIPDYEPAES